MEIKSILNGNLSKRLTNFMPLVSIIITSYNYEKYLANAIDSALSQDYPNIEVIVVDDGSNDSSPDIVKKYGTKVLPILKKKEGQASAINEGYKVCQGEIICLLDSDDMFCPDKVSVIKAFFEKFMFCHRSVMVYERMEIINENGVASGGLKPKDFVVHPPNLYEYACKYGYVPHDTPPTSGLSFSRKMAEQIFPIPKLLIGCPDAYLVPAAELFGEVYGLNQILSKFRVHGKNLHLTGAHLFTLDPNFTMRTLIDKKLNEMLVKQNKKPIICFRESLYAYQQFYNINNYVQLIKLAFKILKRNIDKKTLYYSLLSIYLAFKIIVRKINNFLI